MDKQRLAAAPTSGGLTELRLHWHQRGPGSFESGSQGLVEPGEMNDPTRRHELRVNLVHLDRGRKFPVEQTLQIRDHPIHDRCDGTQCPWLLWPLCVVRVTRRAGCPSRGVRARPMDDVGEDHVSDQAK